MTGKYMYDCYDKDEKPLGIIFEDGTKELLKHHPDVKYVRGIRIKGRTRTGTEEWDL